MNWYGRWWFVAILPSLVMLVMAVGKRLGQYGITEPRYFLLVLALWMLGLSLYYGITASRNIKLIPLSLAAVAVLTSVGPWGAYVVSKRSQVARLDRVLEANHMGRVGDAGRASAALSFEVRREMSAVLRYLDDTRGATAVAAVLGVPADTIAAWRKDTNRWNGDDLIAGHAMDHLGLAYVNKWEQGAREQSVWVNQARPRPLEVTGFELAQTFSYPGPLAWIGTASDSLQLVPEDSSGAYLVKHGGAPLMKLDLRGTVRQALPADSLAFPGSNTLQRPIVVEGSAEGIRVRMVFESVRGTVRPNGLELLGGSGYVLVAGLGNSRTALSRPDSSVRK